MNFKVKSFSMIAAMAAITLASCSSEEPLGKDNVIPEKEGIGYMSFTIANPSDGTRAGEGVYAPDEDITSDPNGEIFNNGSANEYAICPNKEANVAFYFNAEGKFWGMSPLQPFNSDETIDGEPEHGSHNNYAEKYYTYVTRWRNDDSAAEKPSQVIIILNADPVKLNVLALTEPSIEDFRYLAGEVFENNEYTYGSYQYAGNKYFTMVNSSYLKKDSSAFSAEEDMTITQIEDANICETAELALESPVVVFVERLLAKFELDTTKATEGIFYPFGANAPEKTMATIKYVSEYTGKGDNLDYPEYENREWAAYIINWAINGLEKEGNLLKDISNASAENYFKGWNKNAFHRSFWGESSKYSANGKADGFSTQYRDATYDPDYNNYSTKFWGNDNYVEGDNSQLNTLHYISFNDINSSDKYKYVGERTYNATEGLENYGPYRYASHYLIGAQLLIEGIDYDKAGDAGTLKAENKNPNNRLTRVTDKYYAYNFYWANAKDYIRYAYHMMASRVADGRNHSMKAGGHDAPDINGAVDGIFYTADETPITVDKAAEYFELAPARLIHGDGRVILSLKEGKEIYVKVPSVDENGTVKDGPYEFVPLTKEQITNMPYLYTEAAQHFTKGAMYYAVPVQHNQGKTEFADVKINKDNGKYKVGDFGVVRNHWYRLALNTIGSIGTPVDDPDQPIIPDPEDDYYIALEIVVLPWHVIDNGSVDL